MLYIPDPRLSSFWEGTESFLRPSIFNARDSSFSLVPSPGDDNASVTLVASCNDLLLYSRHENDKKYDFYISNVQTRQWVELPPAPYYYGRNLLLGIIFDNPVYSYDTEIVLNASYRYSVVAIRSSVLLTTKFTAHFFSSTNRCERQWCDRVLSLPRTCTFWYPSYTFCFDEKLHFTCHQGVLAFDQNSIEFDDEIQCHLIEWPVGMSLGGHRVGYSQENLTVSHLMDSGVLRIWVLKDYTTSNWVLQHRIKIKDWVSPESWMTKTLRKFSRQWCEFSRGRIQMVDVLGFDPSNPDVIYVLVPGYIFSCNLSTKTLESACHIPAALSKKRKYKYYLGKFYDFLVMLPSWPTSLPFV